MLMVIMAGGSGTRFWPVSNRNKPKQFLNICGDIPMIRETCERLSPIAGDREILIILGREHIEEAEICLKGKEIDILAEPMGRNTAPCIGLGAIYAESKGYDGPIAFMPADHYIGNVPAFLKSLEQAGKMAEAGGLSTLGIIPTRPETGYGYIRRGPEAEGAERHQAYFVSAFVEKPDPEKARQYLKSGDYYWNAGIFVAKAAVILKEIEQYLPKLYQGLVRLKTSFGTPDFELIFEEVYQGIDSESFDYGIMEKTKESIFVVPCECGWSDVGSWDSLYELKKDEYDSNGNFTEGDTFIYNSKGNYISGQSDRFIACLGMNNCLIIDAPGALLVADRRRSQEIKKIVEYLKKENREKLL
jgi:mannose-1-phosphate guanylyltransferase